MIECINHNDEQEFTAEDSYTLNQFSTLIAVGIEMIEKSLRVNDEIEISFYIYYYYYIFFNFLFFTTLKLLLKERNYIIHFTLRLDH